MKTLLNSVILWLALGGLLVAQPTQVPTVPSFPVPSTTTLACGPVVDLATESGAFIRTCESGVTVLASIFGRFDPGFVNDFTRLPDGAMMALMDDGRIIRSREGQTEWFETARAQAFLSANWSQVVTVHDRFQSAPTETSLYYQGSFSSRKLWGQEGFPVPCTQVFSVGEDKVCFNRNLHRIYRAFAGKFGIIHTDSSVPYFDQEGMVFARPYKDGMLVLKMAKKECPDDATKIPDSAVFCYSAGSCKETEPSQLLYVSGKTADVKVLATGMSVNFYATFSVVGGSVYLVESLVKNDKWQGDYVTRLDLKTGKKSDYLSLEDLEKRFGLFSPSLWIN